MTWDEYVARAPIREKKIQIQILRRLLAASDYKSHKHADGALSDEDYKGDKEQRQEYREEIGRIEAEIRGLEKEINQ